MQSSARRWRRSGAALTLTALVAGGLAAVSAPQAQAADWSRCLDGSRDRQAVFERAADVSGVPVEVLLGVSYLESRWDDHGRQVSSSGGYGPMHLTQDAVAAHAAEVAKARGEDAAATKARGTLTQAASITGLSRATLRSDDVANVCGGAAVLAASQPRTTSQQPSAWSRAIGGYAGGATPQERVDFARQVFDVIRTGEQRTTNDGQRMALAPSPDAEVDAAAVEGSSTIPSGNEVIDCPVSLSCESIPAPYEQTGDTVSSYGNHDLANRPADLSIDYVVIHDTEGTYPRAIELVTDPTYLGWHYTINSADGHVAQNINPKNVGFQAGNWYVNMHSIGIEHTGFAATGATWYTESMYRSSAALVKHLATKYGVPLDRGHVIGHDQVPGIKDVNIPGMHWDPGPYWNWEHYMSLLGAPLKADRRGKSDVVTVVPGFRDNVQPVSNCDGKGSACKPQGTNFVYLRTAPSDSAPLVNDEGLHQKGQPSTTEVSDIGPRLAAGQKVVVAKRQGDWVATWYLGELAWFKNRNTAGDAVIRPSQGTVVTTSVADGVPVYGRAYPETSAYPAEIPDQGIAPLLYRLKPGQRYVLADATVPTDYYYAKTYDASLPGDHTVVVGKTKYYQIWFGHRIAYVMAKDVQLNAG